MDGRRQDGVVINLAAETGDDVVAPLLSQACGAVQGDALAPQAPPALEEPAPAVEEGQETDSDGGMSMTAGDAAAAASYSPLGSWCQQGDRSSFTLLT